MGLSPLMSVLSTFNNNNDISTNFVLNTFLNYISKTGNEGSYHSLPLHPLSISNDGNDRLRTHDCGHRSRKVLSSFDYTIQRKPLNMIVLTP